MEKFKGYYFKFSTPEYALALIPAKHGDTASLQIVTEICSYNIGLDYLKFGNKPPQVKTNAGIFSDKGIMLDINTDKVKLKALLRFGKLTPLSYDIMGPFKLLAPVLQCRHRVISMYHTVNGRISVNNESYSFRNGKGYIEGDEGTSFPSRYIWAQCFYGDISVMLSAADVPLPFTSINGVIGVISTKDKEYRFGTYLGAKIKYWEKDIVIIKQNDYTLTIRNQSDKGYGLFAPESGCMSRTIHENVKCRIYVSLKKKGKSLLEFISSEGSFECEK